MLTFFYGDNDQLVDVVVDHARSLLYATSRLGRINVFQLTPDGRKVSVVQGYVLMEKARDYLASRRQTSTVRFIKEDVVKGVFIITQEESMQLHGKSCILKPPTSRALTPTTIPQELWSLRRV